MSTSTWPLIIQVSSLKTSFFSKWLRRKSDLCRVMNLRSHPSLSPLKKFNKTNLRTQWWVSQGSWILTRTILMICQLRFVFFIKNHWTLCVFGIVNESVHLALFSVSIDAIKWSPWLKYSTWRKTSTHLWLHCWSRRRKSWIGCTVLNFGIMLANT